MPTPRQHKHHEDLLLMLTGLPTAAGREQAVIRWVEDWAKRHKNARLRRDRFGNLMLSRAPRSAPRSGKPIIFTAHMDHPAWVVLGSADENDLRYHAQFLGGVRPEYLTTSHVLHHATGSPPGTVTELDTTGEHPRAVVVFPEPVTLQPGDVLSWCAAGRPRTEGDRLHAPACDDLAALAAAIAAFEMVLQQTKNTADVRVLLTRSEEVGFIGAIAACRGRFIPKAARLIALENSKSFADSPIGAGPIVRVGDRTSTFDPALTYRVGQVAQSLADDDDTFQWQRKLMPGGTCEASAYQALGYAATCVCLPLGHYHNMNEKHARIDPETISLADYHSLVRLLIALGASLDDPAQTPPLTDRLEQLFQQRRHLLD